MTGAFLSGLLFGGALVVTALYVIPAMVDLRRTRGLVKPSVDVIDLATARRLKTMRAELAATRRRQRQSNPGVPR